MLAEDEFVYLPKAERLSQSVKTTRHVIFSCVINTEQTNNYCFSNNYCLGFRVGMASLMALY